MQPRNGPNGYQPLDSNSNDVKASNETDHSHLHFCYYFSLSSSGTPALTSRGFKEEDFEKVADFIDTAADIASDAKAKTSKA